MYQYAAHQLGLDSARCLVVEDSRNGLLAAVGASMACVITWSAYTASENFRGAAAVYSDLGDPPGEAVTFDDLEKLLPTH